jgi:hypothetical protein
MGKCVQHRLGVQAAAVAATEERTARRVRVPTIGMKKGGQDGNAE